VRQGCSIFAGMNADDQLHPRSDRSDRKASQAMEGLGERIRTLRQRRHMSLRGLAAAIQVTPSLISQIERGKTNPSVVTLYAIAGALDVSVDALFEDRADLVVDAPQHGTGAVGAECPDQPFGEGISVIPVVRRARRRRVDIEGHGGDITWELLTARPEKRADFLEITYGPGASSALSLMRHAGREYGLILEGELWVSLGFGEAVLGPGDSIGFSSRTPHRFENRGSVPMRAVWFVLREADAD